MTSLLDFSDRTLLQERVGYVVAARLNVVYLSQPYWILMYLDLCQGTQGIQPFSLTCLDTNQQMLQS